VCTHLIRGSLGRPTKVNIKDVFSTGSAVFACFDQYTDKPKDTQTDYAK